MSIPSLIKGIVLNSDIESGEYFKFKPVSDMDNLKYLASQLIYINYLQNTENKTITNTLLSSYKENVVQRYRQLKPRVSLDLNYITDIFDRILHSDVNIFPDNTEVTALLSVPFSNKSDFINISSKFYIPYIHAINNTKIEEEKTFSNPIFLTPSMVSLVNPNTNSNEIYIVMNEYQFVSYKFKDGERDRNQLEIFYSYMSNLNLNKLDISDILLLLSNFAYEYRKYDMQITNVAATIPELCKDLVLDSNISHKGSVLGSNEFIQFLKQISNNHHIEIQNNDLFVKLLQSTGSYSNELVSYFQKDPNEITVSEMEAFRKSVFSSFLTDKLKAGIESAPEADIVNPDGEDTTESDDLGDTSSSELDGTNEDEVKPLDDPIDDEQTDLEETGDVPVETDKESSEEPWDMMLELAKDETLSDLLFRKELGRVIANIINSDSDRYDPDELQLLKKWNSEWINLVSVQTTKQFLSLLSSIRLGKLLR